MVPTGILLLAITTNIDHFAEEGLHIGVSLWETTWIIQRVGQRFCAYVSIRNLPRDDRCWKRDRWERGIVRPTGCGLREGMDSSIHGWSPLRQGYPYQVDRPRRG